MARLLKMFELLYQQCEIARGASRAMRRARTLTAEEEEARRAAARAQRMDALIARLWPQPPAQSNELPWRCPEPHRVRPEARQSDRAVRLATVLPFRPRRDAASPPNLKAVRG